MHWTERKEPQATLKDEGHGWLSAEMRKRIKWDIGITNLTKKELKRL